MRCFLRELAGVSCGLLLHFASQQASSNWQWAESSDLGVIDSNFLVLWAESSDLGVIDSDLPVLATASC
eukprot:s4098_g1.t1